MNGSDLHDEWERLARRAAEGEDIAFARLARDVRPLLLRWALVQTADADDAEDVVQAALMRLHGALPALRHDARVTTWLYAVLRSAAADWRRSARRRQERDRGFARDQSLTTTQSGSGERTRLLELVRAQLGDLPARQREVLDLVDLQGHAPAAAADMLAMNHNTARVHLLRARRSIRARILAAHPALVEDA